MHIQSIQSTIGANHLRNSRKKTVNKQNSIVFKSFESKLSDNVLKNFDYVSKAEQAFHEVLDELLKNPNIEKTKWYDLLSEDMSYSLVNTLEKLSRPIAEVPAKFRDLVLKGEGPTTLISRGEDDLLTFRNYGKRGFLNFLFSNQNAESDVSFMFFEPKTSDHLEFGLTKYGGLKLYGYNDHAWRETQYSKFLNNIQSHKYGSIEPFIW